MIKLATIRQVDDIQLIERIPLTVCKSTNELLTQ